MQAKMGTALFVHICGTKRAVPVVIGYDAEADMVKDIPIWRYQQDYG
jgi:hypothetical protein